MFTFFGITGGLYVATTAARGLVLAAGEAVQGRLGEAAKLAAGAAAVPLVLPSLALVGLAKDIAALGCEVLARIDAQDAQDAKEVVDA